MSYSLFGANPLEGGVEQEALAALTPLLRYWHRWPLTDPRRAVIYHVDSQHGDNSYDGLTWDSPVLTIAQAITLNNATLDWGKTPKHYNSILVRPGQYPENLESLPYYCSIIGVGGIGLEKARIGPPTGSVVTGNPSMMGCHLANLHFEVKEAVPILDLGICNNNLIEDCLFTGAAEVNPEGINTENCSHLILRRNRFLSGEAALYGFAYGVYHQGGADKYAHSCLYIDNWIFAMTAGIYIADTCTDTGTVIQHNLIGPHDLDETLAIGIDDNHGKSWVIDNFIIAEDCIDHAGGNNYLIANREIQAGAAAIEFAGTT